MSCGGGGGGLWVFLTTMSCQPCSWASHPGSSAGSMATMATGTTGERGHRAGYSRVKELLCQKEPQGLSSQVTTSPNSAAHTEIPDFHNCFPELTSPEAEKWLHDSPPAWLDRVGDTSWVSGPKPPFEAACCSYNLVNVQVFKHLLQPLNIYFIFPLRLKSRLEEQVWERRSMGNTSVTSAVFKLKTDCLMQSPSKWVKT